MRPNRNPAQAVGDTDMRRRAGVYVGWVGRQNLGDEAIWDVCREQLPEIGWHLYESLVDQPSIARFAANVSVNKRHAWSVLLQEIRQQRRLRTAIDKAQFAVRRHLVGSVALLGGGTLINLSDLWLDAYRQVRALTKSSSPVLAPGVASPEFWTGVPGWRDRRREWRNELEHLPMVGVRGPLSKELLDDAGFRGVSVVGDPAVMFHRQYAPNTRKPVSKKVNIGLNFGQMKRHLWGTEERLTDVFETTIRRLQQDGHDVTLIAVYPNDVPACEHLASRVRLDKTQIRLATTPETFFNAVSDFDVMVGLKLHASILAAAANIPVVILEYQPKCVDFARSINWPLITRTSDVSPTWLVDSVHRAVDEHEDLSLRLCTEMCRLSKTFLSYCAMLRTTLYK